MNLLVLGSGGREHALVNRLIRDPSVQRLWCAPGNPGIDSVHREPGLSPLDHDGIVGFCRARGVDLVVPGPEAPLAAGLADRLAGEGIRCFGPTQAAARLETSKAFAKAFMERHGVPTARFQTCHAVEQAVAALNGFRLPVVVKADGLAAGKGVVIANDRTEAVSAIEAAMLRQAFGEAGRILVLEEFLEGTEASFFAICDGEHAIPAGSAQDHKRVGDDDQGPNTGGMGAFAPSALIDGPMEARVLREVVAPVLDGMRAEGHPFVGFLYAGLIIGRDGPKVIEFNVRFGDPEAQVVLPLLEGDLASVLARAAAGGLREGERPVTLGAGAAVGVVMASRGYPGAFERGHPISGLDEVARWQDVQVFHAGTAWRDGQIVTDGGRVLTVTVRAATFAEAVARAYEGVDRIRFEGAHARRDIGRRALACEQSPRASE